MTTYGTASSPQKFTYSIFLNTVQSSFAALSGLLYLYTSTSHPHKPGRPAPIFPTTKIFFPLLLVSITSSLASPFGYASLKHVDYVTFILAKSSKLLPVMFLHLTIFRKSFPLYKYAVVAMVTLGVAVFTLHHPSTASKAAKHGSKTAGEKNLYWGLFLLGVNLIMDGLTNSTQDYIFGKFKPYSGPQMMCAQNIMATALTISYLFVAPYIGPTAFGQYIGMDAGSELTSAISFIKENPAVGWDVVGFAVCGAVGQVFIYHTLSVFSSMLLVTVTVTRKMLTMILSVVWFGHRLSGMQWGGVGLVFSGVAGEAIMNRREKQEKARKAKARVLSETGQERAKKGL
jgi:UDP-galactose transporter B1